MPRLFVDVAIPLAVDRVFTYSVPEGLEKSVVPGMRVIVTLGRRRAVGFIVGVSATAPDLAHIKPILDLPDPAPIISEELLALTRWMADYYFAAWGDVLKAILVQGTTKPGKRYVALAPGALDFTLSGRPHTSLQTAIVRELAARRGKKISVATLQKKLGGKTLYSSINDLAGEGLLLVEEKHPVSGMKPKFERIVEITAPAKKLWLSWLQQDAPEGKKKQRRSPGQEAIVRTLAEQSGSAVSVTWLLKTACASLSVLRTLEKRGIVAIAEREVIRTQEYDLYPSSLGNTDITLNPHQVQARDALTCALDAGKFQAFFLHGVTGSGKTQVYIEAIRAARERGKTAIVLVPEISLTPQIIRRFKLHFGDEVVALHSRMTLGERYDAWRLARDGTCPIVIGPRSAVFAPLANLGLIVIDEEQESSYKQYDQTPRYHARDVAVMRAHLAHAVVVLGSATPSMESYTNATAGKYTLLELPERADNAKLPQIEIVDMGAERKRKLAEFFEVVKEEYKVLRAQNRGGEKHTVKMEMSSLSDLLKEKIDDRLRKREGIILLQNRRGFAPFVECLECGYVETCDECNISLTYHLAKRHLRCHYCGFVKAAPETCPGCRSVEIRYRGFGTQRVEDELQALFPAARILRMDLDSTAERGAHDAMLRRFSDGDADILLGTQMVAKGLDFSRVTLVGVISADTQMLLPDFRSSERTFQLLTQVAGRAGRSAMPGEVVIQTLQPRHQSLRHVLCHDFKSFYKEEITFRDELAYPPASRLVLVEFLGPVEPEVMKQAQAFGALLKQQKLRAKVLGPAPAALAKLRGMFRWHLVIKDVRLRDEKGRSVHAAVKQVMQAYLAAEAGKKQSVRIIIDVDPVGMM